MLNVSWFLCKFCTDTNIYVYAHITMYVCERLLFFEERKYLTCMSEKATARCTKHKIESQSKQLRYAFADVWV